MYMYVCNMLYTWGTNIDFYIYGYNIHMWIITYQCRIILAYHLGIGEFFTVYSQYEKIDYYAPYEFLLIEKSVLDGVVQNIEYWYLPMYSNIPPCDLLQLHKPCWYTLGCLYKDRNVIQE